MEEDSRLSFLLVIIRLKTSTKSAMKRVQF